MKMLRPRLGYTKNIGPTQKFEPAVNSGNARQSCVHEGTPLVKHKLAWAADSTILYVKKY